MNIQINIDNHITGRETLVAQAEATISDENGEKTGGRDRRCVVEARLESRQPIAVTDASYSLAGAITGPATKLKGSLNHTFGRMTVR